MYYSERTLENIPICEMEYDDVEGFYEAMLPGLIRKEIYAEAVNYQIYLASLQDSI